MDNDTLEYRKQFYERLQNVLQEKHKNNIIFNKDGDYKMSELENVMRLIIKRLGESEIADRERISYLDSEIQQGIVGLSDKDRFSKLLLVAQDALLTQQIRERTSGKPRFMSESEVERYAKQKGLSINDALEELVPLGKIEGF